MDDTSALAAPPPLTIHCCGDGMVEVAEVLCARLPGARIAAATAGTAAAPPPAAAEGRHRGARPVLVLMSADASTDDARAVLVDVASSHPRQARVWIAVDSRTERGAMRALDDLLDELAQPNVDAVVVVPSDRGPAAAALAIEAWVWLRHDAPSGALMDLRDDTGACRFAAIVATAPAAPPTPAPPTAGVAPGPGSGEHAVLLIRRSLDGVEQGARTAAAAVVAAAPGQRLPDDLLPPPPGVDPRVLDEALAGLDADDAVGLWAAERACAEESARGAGTGPADATASAAARGVVQAQTALEVESSRTGLAAKIGRRKRLDAARSELERAQAAWSHAYVEAAAQGSRRAAAAALVPRLAAAAAAAESRASTRTADQHRVATGRWLSEACAAAAALEPPGRVDPAGLSRAWGRAAPATRRYLVVPAPTDDDIDVSALFDAAAGQPDGKVLVTFAAELRGPIAAALVMGVPLAALAVPTLSAVPLTSPGRSRPADQSDEPTGVSESAAKRS